MLVVTQASYISILPLVLALFLFYSWCTCWLLCKLNYVTILPMVLEVSLVGPLHQRPIITPPPQLSPCPEGEMREIAVEYCYRVPKSLPVGVNLSIGLEHPNHAGYNSFPAKLPAQPLVQPTSPSWHSTDWECLHWPSTLLLSHIAVTHGRRGGFCNVMTTLICRLRARSSFQLQMVHRI